ncbi:hypothetical protein ABEB36_000726 [Hypothenemus hampei]|uniref:Uncharacterized protein n=1 Tax=Hypothenemus hampei TaxID=57062 RepID=A0ABD1FC82_HYPHA
MEAPGDSSITVVDPHVEAYADNNLNEKNLGTQYIYTTEGQLIPADGDHTTPNIELNPEHFHTVHVTETQNIHIQQVDYQYQQQYSDAATVPEVVSVSASEFVQNPNTYVMQDGAFASHTSQEIPHTEQAFACNVATTAQPQTYEYLTNRDGVAYEPDQQNQTPAAAADITQSVEISNEAKVLSNSMKELKNEMNADSDQDEKIDTKEEIIDPSVADEEPSSIQSLQGNPAIEIENESEDSEIIDEKNYDITINNLEEDTQGTEIQSFEEDEDVIEEHVEEKNITESVVTSRPRGRKPKTDIPLHILGHDVNKPIENSVNGKTPKPRLGVKVPYRNLTSQIVSKAEIEKEIIERGKKKQEEKQDILFARQLTSRLAQKIAPGKDKTKTLKVVQKSTNEKSASVKDGTAIVDSNGNQDNSNENKPKPSIDNNSDLLAILEGEGTIEELTVASEQYDKKDSELDETNLKNLEKEIALQQLQDLPYLSPKPRLVKGKKIKVYSKGSLTGSSESQSTKALSAPKSTPDKSPLKSNVLKLDVEPQIKVNMTLKTYSRKRKSTETTVEPASSPPKKLNIHDSVEDNNSKANSEIAQSGPVYITKSSRIIKKKVIWDPDESASKTKVSSIKTDSPTKLLQKSVQSKNDNRSADLSQKSAGEIKVKTDKKVEEKPVLKKPSPVLTKTQPKAKKPRSEVDRLLGDEGAIKMLYDLKNSELQSAIEERRKKTVISVEKTFKELAKKANEIKSDLVNTSATESPKFLRKKDSGISTPVLTVKPATSSPAASVPGTISRQKSKDSSRSTPPHSPAFSFPNEVSYLIRRRSSSSISSEGGTGGSLDDSEERLPKRKATTDPLKVKKPKKSPESEKAQKRAESRIGHYSTFTFKKTNKSVTIDLHTGNTEGYFTSEFLTEVTTILNKISKEKDCNVVLIRSNKSSIFSYGLNYKELISDKDSTLKTKASELAEKVKAFIQCLMDFPKVLIAGIEGQCSGLAVTILPLFDIVIASDDACFSTAYSQLGCAAEAGFLLSVPHVTSYGLAAELLYASNKLTADEAYRRGLVSKLCWPEKYQETVKATVQAVAQGSKQVRKKYTILTIVLSIIK